MDAWLIIKNPWPPNPAHSTTNCATNPDGPEPRHRDEQDTSKRRKGKTSEADTGAGLEQLLLPQLTSDQTLKERCARMSLFSFWISNAKDFLALSQGSLLLLLSFTTIYKCEVGFSALSKIKTEYRNKLDATPDASRTLHADSRQDALVKEKHAHMSH